MLVLSILVLLTHTLDNDGFVYTYVKRALYIYRYVFIFIDMYVIFMDFSCFFIALGVFILKLTSLKGKQYCVCHFNFTFAEHFESRYYDLLYVQRDQIHFIKSNI